MYKLNKKQIFSKLKVGMSKNTLNSYLSDLHDKLTKREFFILKQKLSGYKNIEIAKQYQVCPATITKDIKKIQVILKEYLSELRQIN